MLKYELKNIIFKKISQAKNKTIKKIRIKFDMKKKDEIAKQNQF
jgi:hypothetical protein